MKLSPGQLFAKPQAVPYRPGGFWPMFNAAWSAFCKAPGGPHVGDKAAMEAFRHEQLDACGFASLHDVDKTNGFDAVMLLLAQIANDVPAVEYFAVAAERRYRQKLIPDALADISRLEQRECGWAYAAEICRHMRLGLSLRECPVEHLHKVYVALDAQRRRLRRHGGHSKPHPHHEAA